MDILPIYIKSNPPPAGITINFNVTSDSDNYSLPIPDSE